MKAQPQPYLDREGRRHRRKGTTRLQDKQASKCNEAKWDGAVVVVKIVIRYKQDQLLS